jgi:hypothetical protein
MNQSSVLPLALATALLQPLHHVLALSAGPCQELRDRVAALITRFYTSPLTSATTYDFENDLRALLDECGRHILQTVFNHLEANDPQDAPKHTRRDRQDYVRKNHKTPNRGGIATLFGTIQLQRCLYEPLQDARDDDRPSFAPLEQNLGIVAANATPALAERVGRLAAQQTQQELLQWLQHEHHVRWSVEALRKVTAAVSGGIAEHLRAVQRQTLLDWLEQARQSKGRGRVVLAVGRDGIMLPIRHEAHYKEGGVVTLSVYDRRGRRLGTLYLAEMPQAMQATLSAELTALLRDVLTAWEGPLPRLVYLTDAGYHQTHYFQEVLQRMENPRVPGQRLQWLWIIDFYHAASYVTKLAQVLFSDAQRQHAWAHRMRHLLRDETRGVQRVLSSAAQYYGMKSWTKAEAKAYSEAYGYLQTHRVEMKYSMYKESGLPIGSGVTEAGCKVVFTQRFKESGMKWSIVGGEVILRLRVAVLSGVWEAVYRKHLNHQPEVARTTLLAITTQTDEKAA